MEHLIMALTRLCQNKNRQLTSFSKKILDQPGAVPWERKPKVDQLELEAAERAGVIKGLKIALKMLKEGAEVELPFEAQIQEHYRPDYQHKIAASKFQKQQDMGFLPEDRVGPEEAKKLLEGM